MARAEEDGASEIIWGGEVERWLAKMKRGVVAELAARWSSLWCSGGDEFCQRNSTAATAKQRRKELHGELES
jgi:hypothetical protein